MIQLRDQQVLAWLELHGAGTPQEAAKLPVIHKGQWDDLILEDTVYDGGGHYVELRAWLSRMGPEDGEEYRLHVEARRAQPGGGGWQDIASLWPHYA